MRIASIVQASALVGLGYLVGSLSVAEARRSETLYSKLEVLAEVLGEIETNYVDMLSPTELIYGAAKGAATELDAHSEFFTPEEFRELRSTTEGEYTGIGVELKASANGATRVSGVYPDSPAARAGIAIGDGMLSIDEKDVRTLNVAGIQARLRGPVGTKVVIGLEREGQSKPWTFTLVRGWIRVAPIVTDALDDGINYARLKTFSARVAIDLENYLDKSSPSQGLILDLRGNPGGLFDEAVAVCDLFLSEGPIVSVVGRAGRDVEKHVAHRERTQRRFPIAVLIDDGSASAAEIVAGCLKDRNRARLFGSKSYGKGSVQSILDLSDGSGLKLTIARYLTPSGVPIDGHGIEPHRSFPPDDLLTPLHTATQWLKSQSQAVKN